MRTRVMKWFIVMSVSLIATACCQENVPDKKAPLRLPANNNWSGFPVGSWVHEQFFYKAPSEREVKETNQTKWRLLTGFSCDGAASMHTFTKVNDQWVRNLYSGTSGTGVRVDLSGWQKSAEQERIIYDGESVKTYNEEVDWKQEPLPDEAIQVGDRKLTCRVRSWTSAAGEKLKLWFAEGLKIPLHMVRLGRHRLNLVAVPELVRLEWYTKENVRPAAFGHVLSLSETVEIDQQRYDCVLWEGDEDWGSTPARSRTWLHEAVPGREVKRETRVRESGELLSSTTIIRFHVQQAPATERDAKRLPGGWARFPAGATAIWTVTDSRERDKTVWQEELLGFHGEGFPILQCSHTAGRNAGVVTWEVQMPWPEITETNVTPENEKQMVLKLPGGELPFTLKTFRCKDEWDRPWQAALGTAPGVDLPRRTFDSWFVDATLSPNTVTAAAIVSGQLLIRRVVAMEDVVTVGERQVKCVKEEEHLRSPNRTHVSTIWHSHEVPGALVKKVDKITDNGKEYETSRELTAFDPGTP